MWIGYAFKRLHVSTDRAIVTAKQKGGLDKFDETDYAAAVDFPSFLFYDGQRQGCRGAFVSRVKTGKRCDATALKLNKAFDNVQAS